MAELFLSYAHQDIGQAETLAQLLEANGLTVWWDGHHCAVVSNFC